MTRRAVDDHYLIFLICFSDCATVLAGSGWKLTCAKYVGLFPSAGSTAHSSTERMFFAVLELDCLSLTMAYS